MDESSAQQQTEAETSGTSVATGPLPSITINAPVTRPDYATILGFIFALGLIIAAIIMGNSNASFFNVPSLLIVLFGTLATTAASFTTEDITKSGALIFKSVMRKIYSPEKLARALVDLSVISKKKGVLALTKYEQELSTYPFLFRAMQMVVDGYNASEIHGLLNHEVEVLTERHKRSASIVRRASEVAPAMGLIGTLVGLVQMLADLENPEAIGPAMALALLTTFYGAILGTVILASMAVKLEKNSTDEALVKTLIKTAAVSIAQQDNPRRLEMLLNAELPPSKRITYFD